MTNALNDYDVFVGRQPIYDRYENIYALNYCIE